MWKNFKHLSFRFQIIKLCCKDVLINNFQRQSCWSNCFEGNRENIFEIEAYFTLFQCNPSLWHYVQVLYFRNGWIDLNGLIIQQSNWRRVYFAQRCNKHPTNVSHFDSCSPWSIIIKTTTTYTWNKYASSNTHWWSCIMRRVLWWMLLSAHLVDLALKRSSVVLRKVLWM